MALKPCLDCGALSDGTRCEQHRKATDNQRYRRRGSTAQRGLAGEHAAMSRHYKAINAVCECTHCGRHDGMCGRQGTPTNPITAGHLIDRADGGHGAGWRPECRSCNSSRGASRAR